VGIKLTDIARMAGVSESTVSLALNDKSVVNERTRERIKKLAVELGYSPNAIAKSLARKKSGTIGLVVPDIENPYYAKLVRIVDELLNRKQYSLVVATSNERASGERRVIENFISERVEGVMIAPLNKTIKDYEHLYKLAKNEIKHVFVTAHYPEYPSSCVMVDLEKGTFDLVDYLIQQGHRKIRFLIGDQGTIPALARMQGYVKAHGKHGMKVDKSRFVHCSLPNFEQAYHAALSLLKSHKQTDAIITMNDVMALGALRAMTECGIRIPGTMSLAGYDNVIYSSIATIPITTVEQDVEAMAAAAVDMLLGMTPEDWNNHRTVMLQPRLIVRESTGPCDRR
jgi:LacI family transcriptional regulator